MSTVNPFTTFHIWPDLVQIKLLESLSVADCLSLRLVSRNWCAGIRYASHVWSMKKPCVRFSNHEYLTTEVHDQLRYCSISTLEVRFFTQKLNAWANPLNSKFRIPQFDKIVFYNGNSSDNIMELLTNYCKRVKSLSLQKCCLGGIQPDLLSDDLNLQSVQEIAFQVLCGRGRFYVSHLVENHFSCLAKLLTSTKFQFLQKLSLDCSAPDQYAYDTIPKQGPRNAYDCDQFKAAMDIFLTTHGAQIKELAIILNYYLDLIDIHDSFKYLKNVETLSLRFKGASLLSRADKWKNAISSFKRLRNITAYYDHISRKNTFEILLGIELVLNCSNISSSLIITRVVDNLNWLYVYPCALLKHLELTLTVLDSSLGDFENSSYKLESLSILKIKFMAGTEDHGIWRNVLVNWIIKIAPNVQDLVVKLNSLAKCYFRKQPYNLNLDHVSDLIHGLKMLTKLDVFCPIEGIPDNVEVAEFRKATEEHCVWIWTECKNVNNFDEEKNVKDFVDSGFRLRIINRI